jgi:L-ascorbate metabolism protein UlaG (beta-lactamase superfamily)
MRYPFSDHWNERRFFNAHRSARGFLGEFLGWRRTRVARPWPESLPLQPRPDPPHRAPEGRVAVTFIGHSTFLIQTSTAAVLTDPVFTTHAGPFGRFGPRRVRPPAFSIGQLPTVDAVLLSHDPYDHLQPSSLRALRRRFKPTFVTTLGLGRFLRWRGLRRVIELDWWASATPVADVEITCLPAQHFSARGVHGRNRTLWSGFLLRSAGRVIYFAGDTGYAGLFKEIGRRLGGIDVALIPIGGYEPRRLMKLAHVNPDEAVWMHLDLRARISIAMHFGTFRLSDEGIDEPVRRLELARAGVWGDDRDLNGLLHRQMR